MVKESKVNPNFWKESESTSFEGITYHIHFD